MAVTVQWLDDAEDILHYRFQDPWNWTDYERALYEGREMMAQKEHYVCIINDLRNAISAPDSFISKARQYIANRPSNTGLAVFMVDTRFLSVMIDVLTRSLPGLQDKYVLVDSFDDAVKRTKQWLNAHSSAHSSTSSP